MNPNENKSPNENHKFKKLDFTLLCGTCYKPKLHEFHLDDLDPSDIIEAIKVDKTNEFHPTEDIQLVNGVSRAVDQNKYTSEPDCYGHVCPTCGVSWAHNYKCWPGTTEKLHCARCFGQSVVEIHRNEDLKKLIEVVPIDGLRAKRLEHESFCVLEATKSENYEKWFEDHILNLRKMIIEFNNKIDGAKIARVKLRQDDAAKLTPEEIEQYKRNATKVKKIKEESTKNEDKKSWDKQLKGLLALVGGNENIAKTQLEMIYKAQGKEIPK